MVENERKFVLSLNTPIPHGKCIEIYQYYLPSGIRMRAELVDSITSYYLCKKTQTSDLLWDEQETEVTLTHFLSYHKYSEKSLMKTRYEYSVGDELWHVDFFKTHPESAPYFVLAECTMPQGRSTPFSAPPANTIYMVPLEEQRMYSAYALTDVAYAQVLYKEITQDL